MKRAVGYLVSLAVVVNAPTWGATSVGPDLNGDGLVNGLDLAELLESWRTTPSRGQHAADLNGDSIVDEGDLTMLLDGWGAMPFTVAARTQLAGVKLFQYPFFEYVRAFNQGTVIYAAIDPTRFPSIVGEQCRVYLVRHKTPSQWIANPALVDVTQGGYQIHHFTGSTIQANTLNIQGSQVVNGTTGAQIGIGYDVVFDCNQNGVLDSEDYIDGLSDVTGSYDEAGLYIVRDTAAPGPYAVTEVPNYEIEDWPWSPNVPHHENLFYPANIASLGPRPLIIVSHGYYGNENPKWPGPPHTWFDHIGIHMASYGYVVMSHESQAGGAVVPGVAQAATCLLNHTDAFVTQVTTGPTPTDALAPLVGLVDTNHIVWMGHSRGGDAVVVAYDRVYDGNYTPAGWILDNIVLISSMAPVDSTGGSLNPTSPHTAKYHVWTGGADYDASNCPKSNPSQTYHNHDRAEGFRQSTSIYGALHQDFHNGPDTDGLEVNAPCKLGADRVRAIMRGYLLPLVKHYVDGDIPSKDFLCRQWERFKPIGAPVPQQCPPGSTEVDVVVNLMYRDSPSLGGFMIDDFQTPLPEDQYVSSSGGSVTFSNIPPDETFEGLADDISPDTGLTWTSSDPDPMNAVTLGGSPNPLIPGGIGDTTRALVFSWSSPALIEWSIVPAERSFLNDVYLSFRAAQGSRHPNTVALPLGDVTFSVTLIDEQNHQSTISLAAIGAGIEEPYQRDFLYQGTQCEDAGDPVKGWNSEFETVRIRLTDFLNNGSGVDLAHIAAVRLNFGGTGLSPVGRLCIDEIGVTKD